MRQEYELTEEEFQALLDASKPTIAIMVGGIPNRTPQENANAAWTTLGKKREFDYLTVKPLPNKGPRFFTAESTGVDELTTSKAADREL